MKAFLAIVLFAASALAEKDKNRLALQNPDLFQGDILGFEPGDRNVVNMPERRWTNKIVPYVIDSSLEHVRDLILKAMKHYHKNTCIRFVERTNEHNYIKLFSGDGCYSYVGMTGEGEQPVSLGLGCHYVGTIVHELGHAIGFFHEQNRSDRDTHIRIFWDNIEPGMESQFALLRPHQNILFNDFDHESIMLYGNYAFSFDGKHMTMWSKSGKLLREPYEKNGLTKYDIERVKKMYEC